MGFDHAQQMELEPKTSSSGTSHASSSIVPPLLSEKQGWDDRSTDRDVDDIAPDELDKDPELKLRRTHTHTLGKLVLRAADDDLPTDWWFASTAIPLIAATFAPMANLLSIAGLVVYWRNKVTDDTPALREYTSQGYPDPRWCYELNVASLVCGFVGNLFLLFNFTRRIRYIVALPATIVLFYIASGILIGITASVNIYVPPGEGEIYSQGFWHAIIAACLYMFNSMILMVNMLGYFLGHYPQHFTLSDEQRNLILQTMMFFLWLGGGAGIFAHIEGWTYPDALYFCDVTILTIGFGDFYATDNLGRGLVFPFSVGGTIILGLMVSSIHRFAGELSQDKVLRKHIETRRVNTLSRVTSPDTVDVRRDGLEKMFAHGRRLSISSPIPNPQIQQDLDAAAAQQRRVGFENTEKDELKETANKVVAAPADEGPEPKKWTRTTMRAFTYPVAAPMKAMKRMRSRTQKKLIMREEKDRFDAMRTIQQEASQFKKWYALSLSVIAFGVLWCIGAIVFWQAERHTQGLSYFQALYFCYVSLLTIGYGDLSPKSNAGKPFFVLWSLVAVPTMTILISDMGDTVIASFKRGTFLLADFTVLPKAGIWHDILQSNPWLLRWATKRVEKKRRRKGLPVGPGPDFGDDPDTPTIDKLLSEPLTEAELTKKLAFAIRRTADDLTHFPGKKYAYEDWVEFTRLIRFTKMDISELEHDEDQEGVLEWDWLDENSPMLSEQSESEWILDRLCESLLRLLKKNNLGVVDSGDPKSSAGAAPSRGNTWSTMLNSDSTTPSGGKLPETSPAQERRQRAVGADALLTFFTGERRGTNAYAANEPIWSKKAHERKQTRRRSSAGLERRGPFSKMQHSGATGAVGGGRGGAGVRTLKAMKFFGDTPGAGGRMARHSVAI